MALNVADGIILRGPRDRRRVFSFSVHMNPVGKGRYGPNARPLSHGMSRIAQPSREDTLMSRTLDLCMMQCRDMATQLELDRPRLIARNRRLIIGAAVAWAVGMTMLGYAAHRLIEALI